MKFRFTYDKKPKLSVKDKAAFSHGDYECRFLMQTMNGQPVAILQRNDPDCDIWKVQYGFSCVFFGTYAEAMEYCRERFCDLSGKRLSR
jgi:hypothetical protein